MTLTENEKEAVRLLHDDGWSVSELSMTFLAGDRAIRRVLDGQDDVETELVKSTADTIHKKYTDIPLPVCGTRCEFDECDDKSEGRLCMECFDTALREQVDL